MLSHHNIKFRVMSQQPLKPTEFVTVSSIFRAIFYDDIDLPTATGDGYRRLIRIKLELGWVSGNACVVIIGR